MPIKFSSAFTYDGNVSWLEEEGEPEGLSIIFGNYQSRGFIEGNEMYTDITPKSTEYVNCEVYEGLKQFEN